MVDMLLQLKKKNLFHRIVFSSACRVRHFEQNTLKKIVIMIIYFFIIKHFCSDMSGTVFMLYVLVVQLWRLTS